MTSKRSLAWSRRGGNIAAIARRIAPRAPATEPATTRVTEKGSAPRVSILKTGRPSRRSRCLPISSSTACMRLPWTDIDMPSGVWVMRIDA
jgi:hypothetical protein